MLLSQVRDERLLIKNIRTEETEKLRLNIPNPLISFGGLKRHFSDFDDERNACKF
jgi:hypothetical protein